MAEMRIAKNCIALALTALSITGNAAVPLDVDHRHIEKLADGQVAVTFDVPVCSDLTEFLQPGDTPAMPLELDGVLIAAVIRAPAFVFGTENCVGVAFRTIRAERFYTTR